VVESRLVCRICGIEVVLSNETAVRMAEVSAFFAAHNSHEEGMGVEATFRPDDDEETG
jgi:hypothetical protein